jgi:PAS domain S-box-containing protein
MDRSVLGKVLIVDDEIELMKVLCETLRDQGYETEGFTSGQEALARLEGTEFDLVLTDLMMPEMDGIEFLKRARGIDANLVGVMMTGQGSVKTAIDAMRLGAYDYVMKPFKAKTLLPVFAKAMEVRRLRQDNVQLRESLAFHELADAIAYPLDMISILNKVAEAAMEQCRADEVSIMLPAPDNSGELYVAVAKGKRRMALIGTRVSVEQGVAGWVAKNLQIVTLDGTVEDKRFVPINPRTDIKHAISLPMLSGGTLVGILNVNITKTYRPMTMGQIKALGILVSIVSPILESAWLYLQIRQAEEKYRNIVENAVEGIFQSTPDGKFITVNTALVQMLGYDSQEELLASITDIPHQLYVNPDDHAEFNRLLEDCGTARGHETQMRRKDGTVIWISRNARMVRDNSGTLLHYEGTMVDITERTRAESQERLTCEVLDLLNRMEGTTDPVNDILQLIRKNMGFEAVGIRLLEGEDFPYYAATGFFEEFARSERYLCARDERGNIMRDEKGNPVLECMCGNILSGRTDPSLRFFTDGGSFWTNSTTDLLASTTEEDRQARTRNRCNGEGYESVALIPLRSGGDIIGLLQLNDRRRNQLTLQTIRFFEGLGSSIGIAFSRKQARLALEEAEEKYRSIFENAVEGIFRSTPEGRFVTVNPAMARMYGYESPEQMVEEIRDIGTELYVDPKERSRFQDSLDRHGSMAGFEMQSPRRDGTLIWISMSSHKVTDAEEKTLYREGIVEDVTARKQAEEALVQSMEKLKRNLEGTIQAMSMMVEGRDPYTAGHQRRVSNLACTIAQEMGLPKETWENIRMAGTIHDIGKMSVPAEILSKPTKLRQIEMNLIKVHSQAGYDVLKDVNLPYPIADIVLQHHERLDGSGYPQGLKNGQILLEALIVAVADVVEAIASHRPYRPALGIDAALEEIGRGKGIVYDAKAVEACLRLFRERGFIFE